MNGCCDDTPTVTPAPQAAVSWCAGNFTLTYKDGRVTRSPRLPAVADGVYPNATVTMVGGCVTAIAPGTNVVYSACDPCVTPAPPPGVATVPIDGNACNLSTFSAIDGLLTLLVTANSSCIFFSGCGNTVSPLTAIPIISPDMGNAVQCRPNGLFVQDPSATTGANFSGCGIVITNGLVTALPLPFAPILNLVSSDGSVIATQNPMFPCQWDLSAVQDPPSPVTSQALSVANAGSLPPAGGGNGFAAVGAVNPRNVYMFVVGFGWTQMLDSVAGPVQVNI